MRTLNEIKSLVKKHDQWRKKECINLIASENVMSPLAEKLYISDLHSRYAEGKPFKRYYQGHIYVDPLEDLTQKLAKKLFKARQVDLRPISGTTANLCVLGALAPTGSSIISSDIPDGGHVSHTKYGVAGLIGLKTHPFPFDAREMNIDAKKTIALMREVKPKLLLLGASLFLFPQPVEEIAKEAEKLGVKVVYDGAHVLGLIAGGQFQDPLREGAEILVASTHKTFPGPQGGIILGDCAEQEFEDIEHVVFPQVICNHHLHRLPSLAITLSEMMEFGRAYAQQTIKNAKALAQSLHELGFNVKAEHKGFTESHQVVVDVRNFGGGKAVAEKLEKNNVILNKNFIAGEKVTAENMKNPSGIRIGVQEMTRYGMKEKEMRYLAELMASAVIKNKNIKNEVIRFRARFQKVNYCFK